MREMDLPYFGQGGPFGAAAQADKIPVVVPFPEEWTNKEHLSTMQPTIRQIMEHCGGALDHHSETLLAYIALDPATMVELSMNIPVEQDLLLFLTGTGSEHLGLTPVTTYHILSHLSLGSFEEIHEFLKDHTLFKTHKEKGEWFLHAFGPQCLKSHVLAKWIKEQVSYFSGEVAKGYGCFNQRVFRALGRTQGTLNSIEQGIQDAITDLCDLMARAFASYTDATKEMCQANTPGKIGPPVAKINIPPVVTNQDE